MDLEERNQKIIDAIIEKANKVCPGALALIGIYGSFMTGDFYEKSDIDLMIVINDESGWKIGCTFVQDDLEVGHDIYCTTWEQLQNDAKYEHPNMSKLMDSKIVYCAGKNYEEQLNALRKTAKDILEAPFSKKDYVKAEKLLKEAEHYYTQTMISENKSDALNGAGGAVYYIESALTMLNKQYFHYGTKRIYEELTTLKNRPEQLCGMIENVVSASTVTAVKENLTILMKETMRTFRQVKETVAEPKKNADADMLNGTYEEMYSNWRNKMFEAAALENRHLAFMSLISTETMFSEIASKVEIAGYDVLDKYDPKDLYKTAKAYDAVLNEYLKEYKKADIQMKHYFDITNFLYEYLR